MQPLKMQEEDIRYLLLLTLETSKREKSPNNFPKSSNSSTTQSMPKANKHKTRKQQLIVELENKVEIKTPKRKQREIISKSKEEIIKRSIKEDYTAKRLGRENYTLDKRKEEVLRILS
jgi:hypothetical protein